MAGEIQLNLTSGSTYYVSITNKGLNDMQLKNLTEKEAEKLLKNKKYVALPEYIEQFFLPANKQRTRKIH